MRCTICGAKLKKEGEICNNCYKEYLEDEEIKNDIEEVLKVKRKYSINFEIMRYTELIIIFVVCFVLLLISKSFLEAIATLLILAVILAILMLIDKRIALGTKAVFREKSVKYSFKFLFFNTTKIVKYKDIGDITIFQTFRQKRLGFGDICIYAKGAIPVATLLSGFQIKNVENVQETVEKIKEIIKDEQKKDKK